MRATSIVPIALAGVLALGACSGPDETAAASPTAKSEPSANEPLLSDEDAIPSEEEAARAAEASINEANADAELERLERELAEGGGGG